MSHSLTLAEREAVRTKHPLILSDPFFDPQALHEIKEARRFTDLVPIAWRSLKKMSKAEPERKIIQVCGPISSGGRGYAYNIVAFALTIEKMREQGYYIFNQLPFENAIGRLVPEYTNDSRRCSKTNYCMALLWEFYWPLIISGLVEEYHFIPRAEQSIGTIWEREQSAIYGRKIVELPITWLDQFEPQLAIAC